MNTFSQSNSEQKNSSSFKKFLTAPIIIVTSIITIVSMGLVGVIAMKGLIDPEIFSPKTNIVDSLMDKSSSTPSPIPIPQASIQPTIPNPPDNIKNASVEGELNRTFPLWVFMLILGISAIISLIITAWLRYLSLPPETQTSIINSLNNNFIIRYIRSSNFFKKIPTNNLKVLGNKSKVSVSEKSKKKSQKRNIQTSSQKLQSSEYNSQNLEPILVNNISSQKIRKSKKKSFFFKKDSKISSTKTKTNSSSRKKKRRKVINSKIKQPNISNVQSSNSDVHYEPQVTIVSPQEQNPLDQLQPTLAQVMDLRHRRSLSSILEEP